MQNLIAQLMLPQFAVGAVETVFNGLLTRSPQTSPILRKLNGKILQIELKQPDLRFFIVFSENRTDWLSHYEDQADCCVQLFAKTLPKLTAKQQLSELINDKSLILTGDIQILQHFSTLLDELEKDPAELLSPVVGDVIAQTSTDFAKKLFGKAKRQFEQNNQHLVENLLNERPVLVHRLQLVDFYDQVSELEKRTNQLAERLAQLKI
ncbi:hypothetical protein B0187_03005 [Haemophilus paracuniculus]|uniref:Ubiquinone biosynthesis accessory factor UbiJ n=1 Tax=Haemophilus paracuniculus TaxID=734 RepID=A0A1T0ATU3_9PAST|nr:SCP2 sterol-binding domain-containing protein [Haemophilus paracuniculus]OOR99792.1 hypothetical protein B0187_03005 [Haemophilus paracuniculus]